MTVSIQNDGDQTYNEKMVQPVALLAVDENGNLQILELSDDALHVKDVAPHPGEDTTFDRTWGGPRCSASGVLTSDSQIKASAGVIYGYCVHVQTATDVIQIRDSLTAGAGTVRITIPSGKAVGEYALPVAINCSTGIFLDFTGTGSVSVLYL